MQRFLLSKMQHKWGNYCSSVILAKSQIYATINHSYLDACLMPLASTKLLLGNDNYEFQMLK